MANKKGLGMHLSKGIKIGAGGLQFTPRADAPTDAGLKEGRVYMDAHHNLHRYDGTTWVDLTVYKQISVPIYATANAAVSFGLLPIIDNCEITHISVAFHTVPASTSGTVLLECYNYDTSAAAADNLLSTATFDLETLTNDTTADMTLTATAGDLQPDDGDFVYCVITSNNADMTGGTAGSMTIKYMIR